MDKSCLPRTNDVLLGRGGMNHTHFGNIQLKSLALAHAARYSSAGKKLKTQMSKDLVQYIQKLNPPGRFLKRKSDNSEGWEPVNDDIARAKTSQALRDSVTDLMNGTTDAASGYQETSGQGMGIHRMSNSLLPNSLLQQQFLIDNTIANHGAYQMQMCMEPSVNMMNPPPPPQSQQQLHQNLQPTLSLTQAMNQRSILMAENLLNQCKPINEVKFHGLEAMPPPNTRNANHMEHQEVGNKQHNYKFYGDAARQSSFTSSQNDLGTGIYNRGSMCTNATSRIMDLEMEIDMAMQSNSQPQSNMEMETKTQRVPPKRSFYSSPLHIDHTTNLSETSIMNSNSLMNGTNQSFENSAPVGRNTAPKLHETFQKPAHQTYQNPADQALSSTIEGSTSSGITIASANGSNIAIPSTAFVQSSESSPKHKNLAFNDNPSKDDPQASGSKKEKKYSKYMSKRYKQQLKRFRRMEAALSQPPNNGENMNMSPGFEGDREALDRLSSLGGAQSLLGGQSTMGQSTMGNTINTIDTISNISSRLLSEADFDLSNFEWNEKTPTSDCMSVSSNT